MSQSFLRNARKDFFNTEFSEKYTELTEILYNKKLHTKKRSNLICLKNFVNFMYFSVSFVMFFYAMSQRFFLLNIDDADLTDFHRFFFYIPRDYAGRADCAGLRARAFTPAFTTKALRTLSLTKYFLCFFVPLVP